MHHQYTFDQHNHNAMPMQLRLICTHNTQVDQVSGKGLGVTWQGRSGGGGGCEDRYYIVFQGARSYCTKTFIKCMST